MAQGVPRPTRPQSTFSNPSGSREYLERPQRQIPKRDDAHAIAYIKRVLRSGNRISSSANPGTSPEVVGGLLPPLTSSNAIDIQLYALIAILLENLVQSWYSRITPDQQFVDEIVRITAHCTRGLEQRLRDVALDDVLLDELPGLLIEHIEGETCSLHVNRSRT